MLHIPANIFVCELYHKSQKYNTMDALRAVAEEREEREQEERIQQERIRQQAIQSSRGHVQVTQETKQVCSKTCTEENKRGTRLVARMD